MSTNRYLRWSLIIGGLAAVLLLLGFFPVGPLWRSGSSALKSTAASIMVLRRDLIGLAKEEVTRRIGTPYKKSDRYALILLRDAQSAPVGMTPDLLLHIDNSNRIAKVTYAWREYVADLTNRFDLQQWRTSDTESRARMTADFLRRWNSGELQHQFGDLPAFQEHLGPVLFVDEWRYLIGDWEALILDFAPDGTVANAEIGYDD